MATRNRLLLFAVLTTSTLIPKPAHAGGDWVCDLAAVGSVIVGTASMAVDAGFTINAIFRGEHGPGYPDATTARWQVGLMVPQILITGAGLMFNSTTCSNSTAAIVSEALPLA